MKINVNLCLVLGVVVICSILSLMFIKQTRENFTSLSSDVATSVSSEHPDHQMLDAAKILMGKVYPKGMQNQKIVSGEIVADLKPALEPCIRNRDYKIISACIFEHA